MKAEVLPGPEAVARRGAAIIAQEARAAVRERGQFLFAVSGGKTPWRMLELLTKEDVPWSAVHLFQVDERMALAHDASRNLSNIETSFLRKVSLPEGHVHAMPVEDANLAAAAKMYASTLKAVGGTPPVLDLIHLGLGSDGHTASLVPDDPALDVFDAPVAVTGPYQGHRRMTLTYPVLDSARRILWVVTGSDKAEALSRLLQGDRSIPAGRVRADRAQLITSEVFPQERVRT